MRARSLSANNDCYNNGGKDDVSNNGEEEKEEQQDISGAATSVPLTSTSAAENCSKFFFQNWANLT